MAERKLDFSDLPIEIQLQIMSYVPKKELARDCSLVCKYWKTLATDPSLWRNLELSVTTEEENEAFSRLLGRCTQLVNLHLTSRTSLNPVVNRFFGFPNLKELTLNCCDYLDGQIFRVIVSSCPLIESLSLLKCNTVSEVSVAYIARLKHLKKLRLHECDEINDNCIEILSSSLCNIEHLDILLCYITSERLGRFIRRQSRSLRKLVLELFVFDDDFVESVALCHNLELLHLQSWSDFTDQGFKYLSSLKNLKTLAIRINCDNISSKTLESFFLALPLLEGVCLFMREMTNELLEVVSKPLKDIKYASLHCVFRETVD